MDPFIDENPFTDMPLFFHFTLDTFTLFQRLEVAAHTQQYSVSKLTQSW